MGWFGEYRNTDTENSVRLSDVVRIEPNVTAGIGFGYRVRVVWGNQQDLRSSQRGFCEGNARGWLLLHIVSLWRSQIQRLPECMLHLFSSWGCLPCELCKNILFLESSTPLKRCYEDRAWGPCNHCNKCLGPWAISCSLKDLSSENLNWPHFNRRLIEHSYASLDHWFTTPSVWDRGWQERVTIKTITLNLG